MFSKEEAMKKFKEDHPESYKLKPKCNIETCDRMSQTRGLCSTHYIIARNLIESGIVTKEEAEEKLLSPRQRIERNSIFRDDILKHLGKL